LSATVSAIINLTNSEAAPVVTMGIDGRWQITVVVKATYVWDKVGNTVPADPSPILDTDEFAGEPSTSGLLRASDLGPMKPRCDVLLVGDLRFPQPVTMTEVQLTVGSCINKRARVFGERVWLPSALADLVPSTPKPVTSVPIAWERAYGGSDPTDPRHVDARNPAGSGVAKDPKTLHGKPAPQIEDLDKPIGARMGVPSPIGFGPIAPHWQARVALAGTYDEAWQRSRRPLPPADFSPEFFNVAPLDQRLDRYVPGEIVRLTSMTAAGFDQFRLPDARFPVTIVTAEELSESVATIDTVIIEPAQRRLSLLGKAQTELAGGPSSLGQMIVGDLTPGMRKAVETGRHYPWSRRMRNRT
jgi:hypothetical protein